MKMNTRLPVGVLTLAVLSSETDALSFGEEKSGKSTGKAVWAGSWSTSPVMPKLKLGDSDTGLTLYNNTVRNVVTLSAGGEQVRLRLSNKYGTSDVRIENAAVARAQPGNDRAVIPATSLDVTFHDGQTSAVIPAGGSLASDPVDMNVKALEKLSFSFYVKGLAKLSTGGICGGRSYLAPGRQTTSKSLAASVPFSILMSTIRYDVLPFFTGVDVYSKDAFSVVIFGDSTVSSDIPRYLAEKLVRGGVTNIGVLQQGINGNSLLHDGDGSGSLGNLYGKSGLGRFKDDVLNQAGVKKVFVKIGLNDLMHPRTKSINGRLPMTMPRDVIAGYEKLIEMAHAKGIEIYFFSRTPWKDYTRDIFNTGNADIAWTPELEGYVQELNSWLKKNKEIDGYINLDALSDPDDPPRLRPEYTIDGAHFNHAGCMAVADLIDLGYFGLKNSDFTPITEIYELARGGIPRSKPSCAIAGVNVLPAIKLFMRVKS